jgi:hypothetical protein
MSLEEIGRLRTEIDVLEERLAAANDRAQSWKNLCDKYKESTEVKAIGLHKASREIERLRSALETLAQVRHVSGSAQGAFRSNLRIVDAVLLGADVRDLEQVEAIVLGTWKPLPKEQP